MTDLVQSLQFEIEHGDGGPEQDRLMEQAIKRITALEERERQLTIALTNLFYWTIQNHDIGGLATMGRNTAIKEAEQVLSHE